MFAYVTISGVFAEPKGNNYSPLKFWLSENCQKIFSWFEIFLSILKNFRKEFKIL